MVIDKELFDKIDKTRLPVHVAIIMDGNGRWAKKRKLPRVIGHREGIKTVRRVVETAKAIGIKYLSLYTFSTENWSRPAFEVKALMKLIEYNIFKEAIAMKKNDVKLVVTGDIAKLPKKAQKEIERSIEHTKDCGRLVLNLCLNYGSRQEIVGTVNKLLDSGIKEVDEKIFSDYLFTKNIPDPELLIRTSGEQRISNFLLWQVAYSELYFTDILWPDFTENELCKALIEYQKRERRFGGI